MSFVDEREDDEETQQTLDDLCGSTTLMLDRIGMTAATCTHESSWAEETAGAFVDVGEVVGDSIV